jgi:hypothetical protein
MRGENFKRGSLDCGSLNSLVRSGVVHSFTCTREEHMYCTVV